MSHVNVCDMTHTPCQSCATWLMLKCVPWIMPWRMHMCHVTRAYLWHDSFICVTWRVMSHVTMITCVTGPHMIPHMCDMTHSDVWHDSFIVTWLIQWVMSHMWDHMYDHLCHGTYSYMRQDSFMRVTWLIRMWRDSFMRVTWLIHACDMTLPDVWHDVCRRVTWLIQMCDMTHSDVWHDSFIVTWLIQMCDMTLSDVWHDSFIVTWLI